MPVTVAAAAVGLFLVVGAGSDGPQQSPVLPDVQKLGPQPGDRVPDFTLNDQHNRPRTLTSLVGPQGLMLVFYRSADW
jgi:hypothetical protein